MRRGDAARVAGFKAGAARSEPDGALVGPERPEGKCGAAACLAPQRCEGSMVGKRVAVAARGYEGGLAIVVDRGGDQRW